MKRLLFALVLLASVFSWSNPAWPEVLNARYEYSACNVQFAKDFVELREECAEEEDVPIFDSSGYIDEIDENLEGLGDAAEDDDRLEFGLTQVALGADMLELGLKIVGDAFTNKTPGFFECVQGNKEPVVDELEECRAGALETAETATTHFLENDLGYAEGIMAGLETQGVETSGMQEVIDNGYLLKEDIPAAFEEDKPAEVRKLTLRHSRLTALFHLERMSAICEYALPLLEEGGYDEELVEDVEELNSDLEELISDCEYSPEVENPNSYANQNLDCWAETWDLYEEFVSLKTKIIFGG